MEDSLHRKPISSLCHVCQSVPEKTLAASLSENGVASKGKADLPNKIEPLIVVQPI